MVEALLSARNFEIVPLKNNNYSTYRETLLKKRNQEFMVRMYLKVQYTENYCRAIIGQLL